MDDDRLVKLPRNADCLSAYELLLFLSLGASRTEEALLSSEGSLAVLLLRLREYWGLRPDGGRSYASETRTLL